MGVRAAGAATPSTNGPDDDVLVAVDLRESNTINAEVFAQQTRGDVLHLDRVSQRAKGVVQCHQKLQPFLVHPYRPLGVGISCERHSANCERTSSKGLIGVSGTLHQKWKIETANVNCEVEKICERSLIFFCHFVQRRRAHCVLSRETPDSFDLAIHSATGVSVCGSR
jgi:hypothetical protein